MRGRRYPGPARSPRGVPPIVQAVRAAIVGSSFVGVTTALALAAHKIPSALLDIVSAKVALIAKGKAPIRQPGVDEALKRALRSNLILAAADIRSAYAGASPAFTCVGTPPSPEGSQELSFVKALAKFVGEEVRRNAAESGCS